MSLTLPPGCKVIPGEDAILCQCYKSTGERPWKESANLVLPETVTKSEELFFAKIVSIGPGKIIDVVPGDGDNPPTIHRRPHRNWDVGDTVIYSRYRGEMIVIDDSVFLLLKYDDILATAQLSKLANEWFKLATPGDDDTMSRIAAAKA